MIVVDYREQRSGIDAELKKLQTPFKFQQLDTGDYIINDKIYIERKTIPDFIESLSDGRLFKQVHNLRKDDKRAILIIEGAHLPGRPNIRGALASISVQWYMPILRTANLAGTAWLLNRLYSYDKFDHGSFCNYDFRKKRSVASMQKKILLQLRQVGPVLADKLLDKFGSIGGILNADDEDLMQIDGFGNIALAQIYILRGGSRAFPNR
jgi:Fanconi anemia group M protein